jgi:hypothetical protein
MFLREVPTESLKLQGNSRFKVGRVSVEDDERSGRPSTSKKTENVEKIQGLIHEDHC